MTKMLGLALNLIPYLKVELEDEPIFDEAVALAHTIGDRPAVLFDAVSGPFLGVWDSRVPFGFNSRDSFLDVIRRLTSIYQDVLGQNGKSLAQSDIFKALVSRFNFFAYTVEPETVGHLTVHNNPESDSMDDSETDSETDSDADDEQDIILDAREANDDFDLPDYIEKDFTTQKEYVCSSGVIISSNYPSFVRLLILTQDAMIAEYKLDAMPPIEIVETRTITMTV